MSEPLKPGDYLDVFEILDQQTDKVIHTIDVSKKSQRDRSKVADGLVAKVDYERFYTRLVVDDEAVKAKR